MILYQGPDGVIQNPLWAQRSTFSQKNQMNWDWINAKTYSIGCEYRYKLLKQLSTTFTFAGPCRAPGRVIQNLCLDPEI